ncbi:PepSY domain-containing protein [Cytobacillus spongiae]|uniref:PepSY-associated TM helix domain-containing protein n=1 Tax=Cytobacillus spongiae TaxID=2901381 RepID=UPI001F40087E|nr:PepSY-associated TM helix domain-containing protein [Cytobacillus spongiae]UII56628.1 PepSY domain-containing protein [Cytobacillus spongiae]
MAWKWNKNIHLYIGLLCSVMILLLSLTGLVINNKFLFMGSQVITYQNPDLGKKLHSNSHSHDAPVQSDSNFSITEIVDKAARTGKFQLNEVKTVSLMDHGFGPSYYIGLNDDKQTQVVVNTEGVISKIYYNPVTQTAHDWHIGLFGGERYTNLINFATIGMIILTGTGVFLSIRTLAGQAKARRIRRARKEVSSKVA